MHIHTWHFIQNVCRPIGERIYDVGNASAHITNNTTIL